MKVDTKILSKIKKNVDTYTLKHCDTSLAEHISSGMGLNPHDSFVQNCQEINKYIVYDKLQYTLYRVITACVMGYPAEYDLTSISGGVIASGPSEIQSWTTKKKSVFIPQDRYETFIVHLDERKQRNSIMWMVEKTFDAKDIVAHVPLLSSILHLCGFHESYETFTDKSGKWYLESEIIIKTATEISFENLWFYRKTEGAFAKTPYKRSGTLRIPLLWGGIAPHSQIGFFF